MINQYVIPQLGAVRLQAVRPNDVSAFSGRAGRTVDAGSVGPLLEFAGGAPHPAFVHVAAFTGARRGELLNLTWPMVDQVGGAVVITGSASVVEGERIIGTTKGGRRRTVTIDPLTVRVLQAHRARQAKERLVIESGLARVGPGVPHRVR